VSANSGLNNSFTQGGQLAETVLGTRVIKGPLSLPQNATSTLFTVTGGAVLVTGLSGVVTTAIQNQACTLSLGLAPTTGTAAAAGIGGPNSISNLATGNVIAGPNAVGAVGTALVAPSIPASGTATTNLAVNTYHGTVTVTLSAFTLTFVYVNGVQVGTTNGAYDVPLHGTISITYSVSGTWTWASSTNLEINPNGTLFIAKDTGFIAPAGTITWTTSASNTGAMTWYIEYIPVDTQVGNPIGRGLLGGQAMVS
jgi:hypothetical protein